MIKSIKIEKGIQLGEAEISTVTFKELKLRENDIEEFLRNNIDVIFEGH